MGLLFAAVLAVASFVNETVPLRVGGDVKAPVLLQRVEPVYTPVAAKARIAGIVIVEAIIDETGRVTDVQVLKPLPFGLSEAAVAAVKKWQFRPGTLNGNPVPVIFNLTVNFRPPAAASPLTPANFTPRDVAVIEAAIAAAFPNLRQRLLVANETQALAAGRHVDDPQIVREFDARNDFRHAIGSLDLHRPFELVLPTDIPITVDERKVFVTLPGFSHDGRTALELLDIHRKIGGGLGGTREWIVLRNENGRWTVSSQKSDSAWSSP